MKYRLGTEQDLDNICSLVGNAIVEMEKNGIYQWDEIYPARIDFEEDIRSNNLFVAYEEMILLRFTLSAMSAMSSMITPDGYSGIPTMFCTDSVSLRICRTRAWGRKFFCI